MRRNRALAAASLALALLCLTGCASVPAAPSAAAKPVLVIVTAPLAWSEVTPEAMPVLTGLAQDAASGLLVSRAPQESGRVLGTYPSRGGQQIATVEVSGTAAEMDVAIAESLRRITPETAVVVASRLAGATPGHGAPAGVVVVSGGGYGSGLLTSISTRRPGLVTDADVAATVEHIAGRSTAASGRAFSVGEDGRTPEERTAWLARVSGFLNAVERIRVPIFNVYTAVMVVVLLGGWLTAERYRTGARYAYWSVVFRRVILLGLVLPAGATLLHVIDRFPATPQRIVALMLAASGLLWIFAEFAWHKWGTTGAVAFAGIATALILGVDQLAGATLSLSSVFSYSPLIGFRFFGIGNEGAALLVGGALVGLALEMDAAQTTVASRRRLIAIVGLAAVVVCAAPFIGANVIVSVWGTVTFAAFWIAAEKRRVRPRDVAVVIGLALVALVAMVALDRLTGGTHIGRAVGEAASGGLGGLLAERMATSVRIFTDSPLPAIVLAIAAVLAYLRLRPMGRMAVVLERNPVFAAAMSAGLVGGFVGAVSEDSGVVVLALVITYLIGGLVALMLETDGEVAAG
ncbi:MAG: hypothetical protein D9V44_04605 [Actinobacteria bacterium]|nr:MAG: hypothetical protein D9V44_04605 [Actinomycetota bacterium]